MTETIQIYNHFHNGDIFYSRMITQSLSEYFNIIYYHNMDKKLFYDIEDVKEITGIPEKMIISQSITDKKIINSWIGQDGSKYLLNNDYGCSFLNYQKLVKDVLNTFNIKIKNNIDYLPTINFKNLKNYKSINDDMNNLKLKFKKIILICNGRVNSGQSSNFDMSPILLRLSDQNKECLFIITEKIKDVRENLINVNKITKSDNDLLEIGFISTFCNIIVGRASGPYCFTHIKENLLDDKKIYISMSNNKNEGIWFHESVAKQVWTNNYNLENIFKTINDEII